MSTVEARVAELQKEGINVRHWTKLPKVVPVPRTDELRSGYIGTAIRDFLGGHMATPYPAARSPYVIEGDKLIRVASITRWFNVETPLDAQALLAWAKQPGAELLTMTELEVRRRTKGTFCDAFRVRTKLTLRQVIAQRIDGMPIGNSSALALSRYKDFDQVLGRNQLDIQRELSRLIPMIPFSVIEEAGHRVEDIVIVDQGPQEDLVIENAKTKANPLGLRHFTGASVFRVGSEHYLFDVDRGDLDKGVFNAFLSKLPHKVATIAEAYRSLKPAEVAAAELAGKKVVRQGEWFFIPVAGEFKAKRGRDRMGCEVDLEATLQSKGNRPHWARQLSDEGYVSGRVTHGGFEHPPLDLKGWHKAVPNTAIASWSVEGRVD